MNKESKYVIWGNGYDNSNEIPKKVWLYWDGHSDLVNICIKNINYYLPDFEINILNEDNLITYLPDILDKKEDLPLANYTDLIRLELLYKYGGIWIDASILLTENLDWLFNLKKEHNTDLIGFYSDFGTIDYNYPILETWFLACSKENNFIKDWLNEFKKCYISSSPTSYYDEIKSDPKLIQNIASFADYLIVYLSAIKIMRDRQDYKILMLSANETGHKYNFGSNLHYQEFIDLFLKNPVPNSYPMLIKFEKSGRNLLDDKLKIGKFNQQSFLMTVSQKESLLEKINRRLNYLKFILKNIFFKQFKKGKNE
ncbi:glycosyltransferase family 32 protein [Chishuiella changwenlii]|uniref:glycosyltransferase family 32 protein n=1 Tax=Chishuiella changwenlii TaxID=1434701 RepID=UPI002FDB5A1B